MSEVVEVQAGDEVRRYFWRNYIAHSIDGGFFIGAMAAFVNAQTVLPTVVKNMGAPTWLISLMPIVMAVGFLTPPIFTAHWIDRQTRFRPLCLITGVFQRVPYLLAGLVLLLAGEENPVLALAAVALTPLVAGAAGGITMTAWQQLVARTVPETRRSSLFAVRFAISCVIGLGGGTVVKIVLDQYPGTTGYGILHLAAFAGVTVSYLAFLMIRETNVRPPATREGRSLRENLRAIPQLVRREPQVGLYLAAGAFLNGIFITIPFLAIRAQQCLDKPESYVGDLVIAQMAGALLGNLLAGYLGDRFGGKVVVMVSQAAFVAMAAWSMAAATDAEFRAIFFLLGLALNCQMVGANTLNLEICPQEQRSTYLAIILFFGLPSMLAATGLSAAIANGGSRFAWLAGLTIACVVISFILLCRVREPRST